MWKASTSPIIKNFLCLCTRRNVPTKEVLGSRGLNLDPTCELCVESLKSILHSLRDCKLAKSVWKDLGIEEGNLEFFRLNLVAWLKTNCGMTSMFPRPRMPSKILFPQVVWTLWLHGNKATFQIGKIEVGTSACYVKKGVEFYAIVPNSPNKPRQTQIQVRWLKPQPRWTKLNTYGSVFGSSIKAGEGSVLRCSDGEWVASFMHKLGNMSSTVAELWALKDGLIVAKQLGIENICIEMDADFIVYLVSNPSVVNLMLEPPLTDCRNLIKTFPNHTVTHVFKEANGCANYLARMGAELNHDFDVHLLYNHRMR